MYKIWSMTVIFNKKNFRLEFFGKLKLEIGKKEGYFRLGMGPNTGPCGTLEKSLLCNTVQSTLVKPTILVPYWFCPYNEFAVIKKNPCCVTLYSQPSLNWPNWVPYWFCPYNEFAVIKKNPCCVTLYSQSSLNRPYWFPIDFVLIMNLLL